VAKLSISDVLLAPTLYKGGICLLSSYNALCWYLYYDIFLLQCYSKYGEVVQGLTCFFRDKATSDPLKLKRTDCNGKDLVLNSVINFFICFYLFFYMPVHVHLNILSNFLLKLNPACLLMICVLL
jgi:hypothetical protein